LFLKNELGFSTGNVNTVKNKQTVSSVDSVLLWNVRKILAIKGEKTNGMGTELELTISENYPTLLKSIA